MMSQTSHVMTLANSIIGVSVLAMPFCFKQCGILLAVLMLLLCSTMSRLACHFLVKSAVISRRRNFELLAFHAFGHMGKFLAELFIIGFMLGTCIAYFVVVGDLGPQIIGKVINKVPADIRTSLLIITGVFIVLPLGLLRNIDSLSSICTATIVFYLCLVLKIMNESTAHVFAGEWIDNVNYWRPAGILQCLPIFSMALFCQTQLFEIYETIPNVSLEKMNDVVRGALNICTLVYMCVGLFGYVAFYTQSFAGNILLSFEPSVVSELIKLGFVFSLAFSFPLVIFPCRASLNSLLFRRVCVHTLQSKESRFRCLTIAIVAISLVIGILVPNIEFVLGIVGSTIGVMICLIFPAAFFVSISSRNTNERLLAQGILFIGVWIMVLGTYANLYAMEQSTSAKLAAATSKPPNQINNLPLNVIKNDLHVIPDGPNLELIPLAKDKINKEPEVNVLDKESDLKAKDVRQEPPIPVERVLITEKPDKIAAGTFVPEIKNVIETMKALNGNLNIQSQVIVNTDIAKVDESVVTLKSEEKIKLIEEKEHAIDLQKSDNLINLDAIKKEESELAADGDVANARAAERHEQLRKTLEKHKQEQRQMMQEQKEILKDIKEQKQEFEREKQRMAKDTQEILRKNEKKVEINVKEDALPKTENNLRDSDKRAEENNEIGLEKSNKKVSEEKERSVVDELKLNEQQKLDESNNANIAVENSEKKLDLIQEIPHNKIVGESQKISENAADKTLSVEKTVADRQAFAGSALQKEKQEGETKVGIIESNNSDNLKSPIVNVLSKGVLQRSIAEEGPLRESDDHQTKEEKRELLLANEVINASDKSQAKLDRFSVPVALKMTNQSNLDKIVAPSKNKSEPEILAIRRDILANEREKRDVDATMSANDTKVSSNHLSEKSEFLVGDANDPETCSKEEKAKKSETEKQSEKRIPKLSTTEAPLIKTNVYLSEQGITKTLSIDTHVASKVEYANVKQRDLKALNHKDNIEI
ncbi:putative sodium-coupled neutral amino acid transporter 10 isoform X2 [Ooceraea biroi]|uniref:putative sodium-coupled neutral amino acid transporter 10 isoform X2 n=1 Tax=Ooceraea biroi TaxID=2015173 RepID=UPI00097170BA|nr:putative sodium-coupled neutral amino acid transporter 10 isoform X2 [Ooceraea biroi]